MDNLAGTIQLLPQAAMGGALVPSAGLGVPPSPRAYARRASNDEAPAYARVPGGTPGTALGTSAPPKRAFARSTESLRLSPSRPDMGKYRQPPSENAAS